MSQIDRRRFLGAGAAAAAAWAFFSQRAEAVPLTPDNVVSWFDADFDTHTQKTSDAENLDFRTLSLSIHGDPAAPRYAAVMVKRSNPVTLKQFDNLSLAEINGKLQTLPTGADPWWPIILSATGTGEAARFAAVFSKLPTVGFVGLKRDEIAGGADGAHGTNILPWWVEAYGDPSAPLYASVGLANPQFTGWSALSAAEAAMANNTPLEAFEVTAAVQARFDTIVPTGVRPLRVAPTPGGGHYMIFTDTAIGAWECWGDLSLDQLTAKNAEQADKGRFPFQVSATGSGGATRYAATWTSRDDVEAKTFRTQAGAPAPLIEKAVRDFMQDHALNGFQLAVLDGAKLIYSGGFTWAEPSYADITPDTRFRQASVSKIFAAAAAWVLIESGALSLDTSLDAVFKDEVLPGSPPLDTLGKITIQNLLESASGLPQGLIYPAGAPPYSAAQMIASAATATLTGTPGEPSAYAYGNFDYFLLSQAVRIRAGETSFEDALETLVLQPLGMKRTRESRTLLADQKPDEAFYHLRVFDPAGKDQLLPFQTAGNAKAASPASVPRQYGGIDLEIVDGCGGLSAAAMDVARLVSIFSADENPMLGKPTVEKWLNAVKAGAAKFGGGAQHGFDSGGPDPQAGGLDLLTKGGWLPASESAVRCYVGGYSMIAAKNGNSRVGSTISWVDTIGLAVLQSILLGTLPGKDLFPELMGQGLPQGPSMLRGPMKRRAMPHGRESLARIRAAVLKDFARASRRIPRLPHGPLGRPLGGRGGGPARPGRDDRPRRP